MGWVGEHHEFLKVWLCHREFWRVWLRHHEFWKVWRKECGTPLRGVPHELRRTRLALTTVSCRPWMVSGNEAHGPWTVPENDDHTFSRETLSTDTASKALELWRACCWAKRRLHPTGRARPSSMPNKGEVAWCERMAPGGSNANEGWELDGRRGEKQE